MCGKAHTVVGIPRIGVHRCRYGHLWSLHCQYTTTVRHPIKSTGFPPYLMASIILKCAKIALIKHKPCGLDNTCKHNFITKIHWGFARMRKRCGGNQTQMHFKKTGSDQNVFGAHYFCFIVCFFWRRNWVPKNLGPRFFFLARVTMLLLQTVNNKNIREEDNENITQTNNKNIGEEDGVQWTWARMRGRSRSLCRTPWQQQSRETGTGPAHGTTQYATTRPHRTTPHHTAAHHTAPEYNMPQQALLNLLRLEMDFKRCTNQA